MTPLSTQFYSFFVTVGIGIIVGILFDLYRVVRGILQPKKIITNLGDFFFWVFITAIVFTLLIFGNWGEVRLYVFIGLALGVGLYLKLFSRFVILAIIGLFNFINKCITIIKKIVAFIIFCLVYPFKLIYKMMLVPANFLSKCKKKIRNLMKRKIEQTKIKNRSRLLRRKELKLREKAHMQQRKAMKKKRRGLLPRIARSIGGIFRHKKK